MHNMTTSDVASCQNARGLNQFYYSNVMTTDIMLIQAYLYCVINGYVSNSHDWEKSLYIIILVLILLLVFQVRCGLLYAEGIVTFSTFFYACLIIIFSFMLILLVEI